MAEDHLLERRTTAEIMGAFHEVYNNLGFGFLEQIYSLALERELLERGHSVDREVAVGLILHFGSTAKFCRIVQTHRPTDDQGNDGP